MRGERGERGARRRLVRAGVAACVAAAILPLATVFPERPLGACSCSAPEIALVAPDRADDAPLDTKVRIEIPASSPSTPAALILRARGRTAPITVSTRVIAPGGWSSFVELTPSAELEPSTRYEVATVDPNAVPPSRVFGTFRTGRAKDATPPRIDAIGPAVAYENTSATGATCAVPGPWVSIDGIVAEDPGRRDAQLVFAVWLGDANGALDTKKPPTAFERAHDGRIDIGQTSLCDPHVFPLPKAAFVWLGIAALDETGNASAVRRVRVDLAGARQR
jgi:hypothetical protein